MLDDYHNLTPVAHEVRKEPYPENPNDVVRRHERMPTEPTHWDQ